MKRFPDKFWFGTIAGAGFGALVTTIIVENGWLTRVGDARFLVKGIAWAFILGGVLVAALTGRAAALSDHGPAAEPGAAADRRLGGRFRLSGTLGS